VSSSSLHGIVDGMFNVKHWVEAVLGWLGESLDATAIRLLEEYANWLLEEALPARGIGPNEGERVQERHLADSLAFAIGVDPHAGSVLDVGSGVGLPGIPLAILRPQSQFVLLDRSERRSELAARAVRVLDLANVVVVKGGIETWKEEQDGLVMRAALPADEVFPHVRRLVRFGWPAIMGLSRRSALPSVDALRSAAGSLGLELEVVTVPVLDSPTSLLRITQDVYGS